jgi:hypothetical protein
MTKHKNLMPICKNCQLYNPSEGKCSVIILYGGEKITIPVDPDDECFFENKFVATKVKELNGKEVHKHEVFVPAEDIKQVKFWVEDPKTGEKTKGDGVVKIEYPEDFFGKEENNS